MTVSKELARGERTRPRRRRALLRATLPFLVVIGAQTILATVSIEALSYVRAYVGGESLWTKGQKDAIYYLSLYAQSRDETYYRKFHDALAVPLGDRSARRAMEQSPPDYAAARAGFLAGGNDPADVPGLITLFMHAQSIRYFADAVAQWRATDPILDDFQAVAEATRREVALGQPGGAGAALARIEHFNERMTPFAVAFSKSLGAGSRAVAALIAGLNLAAGAVLYALIFWRTRLHLRQRRAISRALAAEKAHAAATLEEIGEAVVRIDHGGRIRYMNPAAQSLAGVGAEAIGQKVADVFKIVDAATDLPLADIEATTQIEARRRRSGLALVRGSSRIPVTLVHTRAVDEDGQAGAVLVLHDMSQEQELIERLAFLAAHDHLTGLANRREFERQIEVTLSGGASGLGAAIALIDLDHFKSVNDSAGHAAGDALLRHTAALLRANVRPGDLVARLGGDEFGAVLADCPPQEAAEIAERLREALQRPSFICDGRRFGVSASLGLVTLPPGPHAVEAALHAADAACYRAKAAGRNRVERCELSASPDEVSRQRAQA